ncbi:MAG: GAF domain-containing protein [Endomicrobia bacterium]|nr:GAF domain-containing protein [Endomicrobiia bacterium]
MTEIEKLEEIFEIVKSLSSTLDLDVLLKRIGEAAERLTNSEASSIMLVDDDKQHLYFKTAGGEHGAIVKKIKVKLGEGIAGNVALTKKSEIVNDVSLDARFTGSVDKQSGFKTRSILAVPMLMTTSEGNSEVIGVVEVLNKRDLQGYTEEDKKLLESLAGLASVTIINAKFSENQRNFFANVTELIVSAIETVRPKYIGRYWKMTQLATRIAKELNIEPKSEQYKEVYFGTLLHDIGYLSSKLRFEMENAIDIVERARIEKMHVIIGAEIVSKISLLKNIAPVIKHHHEHYDGTGYPEGLNGVQIPLPARIISVVDYIEELKINGTSQQNVVELLKKYSGLWFDPDVVKIAVEILTSLPET